MLGNWNINAANEDLITALHIAAVKCEYSERFPNERHWKRTET